MLKKLNIQLLSSDLRKKKEDDEREKLYLFESKQYKYKVFMERPKNKTYSIVHKATAVLLIQAMLAVPCLFAMDARSTTLAPHVQVDVSVFSSSFRAHYVESQPQENIFKQLETALDKTFLEAGVYTVSARGKYISIIFRGLNNTDTPKKNAQKLSDSQAFPEISRLYTKIDRQVNAQDSAKIIPKITSFIVQAPNPKTALQALLRISDTMQERGVVFA